MFTEVVILVFLATNSWLDIKKKEISLITVGIFGITGILLSLSQRGFSWDYLIPAAIGTAIVGLGILTKGAVGIGDGLILLTLGTIMEPEKFLAVFFMGLLGCSAVSLIMLLVAQNAGKSELPFIPFVLLGYVGGLLLW